MDEDRRPTFVQNSILVLGFLDKALRFSKSGQFGVVNLVRKWSVRLPKQLMLSPRRFGKFIGNAKI